MNEPPPRVTPFGALGQTFQKLTNGVSLGCGVLWLGFLVVGAVGIAFSSTAAPFIILGVLWFICSVATAGDKEPWEFSRVLASVLVAWAFDAFLFRLSFAQAPGYYRHWSPAIIVASVIAAYVTWRITSDLVQRRKGNESNPLMFFVGFLVAVFLMFYVVSPTMDHFFPDYWHRVTTFVSVDDEGN